MSRDKWRADAPDWIIWGRKRRSGHNSQGWIKRGNVACRLGQDFPGRIKQKGSPPPGLERPGESGGQRRRKQEAESKVVQRGGHVWKQRIGQLRGNAVIQ